MPETEEADRLISQADALLQRHRPGAPAAEADDLPMLTEVVEDEDMPVLTSAVDPAHPEPVTHTAAVAETVPPDFVEQLIELDAIIHRRVDDWLNNELPAVLSAQIDAAKTRIRDEIHAHVRTTLLSDISQEISELLDANDPRSR
ncbi:hypothetical protein G3580_06270 [Nitrogeniibacter mangrovi]|uniref:Uncharacterized protein n=1 Tax=Nitrogeniibacter mangrovi TaxID=2016596 RepID=A0A6C1BAL2_9RHOO|nr:hypothetical protein G3580_06270 [Nitrogeniibacter mangrovi]